VGLTHGTGGGRDARPHVREALAFSTPTGEERAARALLRLAAVIAAEDGEAERRDAAARMSIDMPIGARVDAALALHALALALARGHGVDGDGDGR